MKIAVIGAGAAGFFAAIHAAEANAGNEVCLYEKSNKILAKVKVSGGGRCNVTHACFDNSLLTEFYPRGQKELRNSFARFSTTDTVRWFESHGVKLKAEADGRMFPVTDRSETIIQCLSAEAQKRGIILNLHHALNGIKSDGEGFLLDFEKGEKVKADRIIITTGGNPSEESYSWMKSLGHTIIPPVPSLFTFNIPASPLKGLEGVAFRARVTLSNSRFETTGPVLVTHWGISGPAVLRLSSMAARFLHERKYVAVCLLNFIPEESEESLRSEMQQLKSNFPGKKISSQPFHSIPSRLWERICLLAGCREGETFSGLSKGTIHSLINLCKAMRLEIRGKTTFREEFVTCGGVSLKEVDMQTMESKKVKGVFFAGEVLDIDGVTGGFNFQAAWTTGYLAGINAGA